MQSQKTRLQEVVMFKQTAVLAVSNCSQEILGLLFIISIYFQKETCHGQKAIISNLAWRFQYESIQSKLFSQTITQSAKKKGFAETKCSKLTVV